MTKLRVLDLFSGIGGFSLGLERTAGFETVAFCEIDPFCRRVLAKHWPEVPIYEDVKEINGTQLATDGIVPDVITGGFPCQNVSIGGAVWGVRTGIDGPESGLWREFARLVDEVGPEWVIIENVRALLSKGLITVLQDLSALGYDAEWHCIPASFAGSPQNRDRVWIIAHTGEIGTQGFLSGEGFSSARQGWACRQEDLQQVYAAPLNSSGWPQPIICRGNNRPTDWMDRISALGNAVIPQIPEVIGRAILEEIEATP